MFTSPKLSMTKNKSTTSPTTKSQNLALTSSPYSKWTPSKAKISITSLSKASSQKTPNNSSPLASLIKSIPMKGSLKFMPSLQPVSHLKPKSLLTTPVSVKTSMSTFSWQKLTTQPFFLMEIPCTDSNLPLTKLKGARLTHGLVLKVGVRASTLGKGKNC